MPDAIDKVEGCLIQHGKCSNRIYLMKLADSHVSETVRHLDQMARENGYTKIIAKVPEWAKSDFESQGYRSEAAIPRFYNGSVSVCFMGRYFSESRQNEPNAELILSVLSAAAQRTGEFADTELPSGFWWSIAEESDADEISAVYREVFESYPFPIRNADYIRETANDNVVYFCVYDGDRIVSVASSEMDTEAENVEMTDFATLPEYRKNGFAGFLLGRMEDAMRARGMKTAYTIARAVSFGMNITFGKQAYRYGGTLLNNTDICGHMESMNVWYKSLA